MEFYEAERQKKIIRFDQQAEAAHIPTADVGQFAQSG
jgi:hypothetical protein